MPYPSQLADRINIRVPDGLRERLKEAGALSGRSMNSEIVARLEQSFDAPRTLDPAIARVLEDHINREVAERLVAIARKIGDENGQA